MIMLRTASAEHYRLIVFSWATVLVFLMFQEFLHKLEMTEEYCDKRILFRLRTGVNLIYRPQKLLQQNSAGEKQMATRSRNKQPRQSGNSLNKLYQWIPFMSNHDLNVFKDKKEAEQLETFLQMGSRKGEENSQ